MSWKPEAGFGQPHEASPEEKSNEDTSPSFSEPNEEDVDRPLLTEAEKEALPVVEVTDAEDRQLLQEFEAAGKQLQVSDILEFKGVQPDSGFVKLRFGDGSMIIVTTESKYFGGLEE